VEQQGVQLILEHVGNAISYFVFSHVYLSCVSILGLVLVENEAVFKPYSFLKFYLVKCSDFGENKI
jgi:hypothetical protein